METKNEVGTVGNKETTSAVETLAFQDVELGEEGRNVNHDTGTDERGALGVDET